MPDVYVLIFAPGGAAARAALEPLGAGRALAEGLGGKLAGVVVGAGAEEVAAEARRRADAVIHVTGDHLRAYEADAFTAAAEHALKGRDAAAVLTLADAVGREVAPRLAARLGGSPLTEVSGAQVEDGRPVFTRPVFGGKAVAKLVGRRAPVVVTVKAGAFEAPAESGAEAPLETIQAPAVEPAVEVLAREAAPAAGVPLDAAPVVVSGGRGVGGPEPFQKELKELAEALGGAVGASLAAVDAGWVPQSYQVGQTGTAVAPTVYIAVGISGASQHLAGISGAKHVVAINKDKDAPIFRVAEVGLVGEWKPIVDALIRAVKAGK
ncbi:MAG: electron transfer flavoprotein subunit alpha/FixB family protein [Firmicutes bacterium]|nr:electron transfer flavoprotein subunit alpha/FixB family protein [Bacillota bacterium]